MKTTKTTQKTKETVGTKKSFNFEQDVESLFNRWKNRNPMVIESRVINQALRGWLIEQLNGKRAA